jgi:hypothetical protein
MRRWSGSNNLLSEIIVSGGRSLLSAVNRGYASVMKKKRHEQLDFANRDELKINIPGGRGR